MDLITTIADDSFIDNELSVENLYRQVIPERNLKRYWHKKLGKWYSWKYRHSVYAGWHCCGNIQGNLETNHLSDSNSADTNEVMGSLNNCINTQKVIYHSRMH